MYNYPEIDMDAAQIGGMVGIVLIIYLVILLFASIFGIISYILTSLGTYTIANRRGIKNAWLAWIPVGSTWIMGCISDQYQQVAKGKNTRRRITLLITYAVTMGASFIMGVIGGLLEVVPDAMVLAMVMLVVALAMLGVAIAYSVLFYFCLYDLYASCKPESGVLYIVLTILVSITTPFLIFSCRNKDQGMPAPQPQYQPPVYGQQPPVYGQQPTWQSVQNQPVQPTYQPQPYQPQQPGYQPPMPPAEPWEQRPEQ
jgi:hypothetical protein